MTDRTMPIGDIIHAWTDAERDVWSAWSKVEQDVSRPETTRGCGHMLDALEASVQQVAELQSLTVRNACGGLSAIPLLPPQAQALVKKGCGPLLSLANAQQHLLSAWFGMARQMAISAPSISPRRARSRRSGAPDA